MRKEGPESLGKRGAYLQDGDIGDTIQRAHEIRLNEQVLFSWELKGTVSWVTHRSHMLPQPRACPVIHLIKVQAGSGVRWASSTPAPYSWSISMLDVSFYVHPVCLLISQWKVISSSFQGQGLVTQHSCSPRTLFCIIARFPPGLPISPLAR